MGLAVLLVLVINQGWFSFPLAVSRDVTQVGPTGLLIRRLAPTGPLVNPYRRAKDPGASETVAPPARNRVKPRFGGCAQLHPLTSTLGDVSEAPFLTALRSSTWRNLPEATVPIGLLLEAREPKVAVPGLQNPVDPAIRANEEVLIAGHAVRVNLRPNGRVAGTDAALPVP